MKKIYKCLLPIIFAKSLSASQVRPLKVALVGMGSHMTTKLIPAMQELGLFPFLYGIRNNQELLREQQDAYRMENIGNDFKAIMSDPELGAIIVAGPPSLHSKVLRTALQHKVPVFLEKPLSFTLDEAEELAVLASAHSENFHSVGFNFIFMPEYLAYKAKEKVKKIDMTCTMGKFFQTHTNFEEAFKNALYYVLIHPLSVLVDSMGSPDDIDVNLEVLDAKKFHFKLQVRAKYAHEECTLNFENFSPRGFSFAVDLLNSENESFRVDAKGKGLTQKELSYICELEHFYRSVTEKKVPKNNLFFNLKVQALADAVSKKALFL